MRRPYQFWILTLIFATWTQWVWAQDLVLPTGATPEQTQKTTQFSLDLPTDPQDWSLSDFLSVSETFNFEKPQLEKTVQAYGDFQGVQSSFDALQTFFDKYRLDWKTRLGLSNWGLNEVLEFKQNMSRLVEMSTQEKQNYFEFIKTTDGVSAGLKERRLLFEKFSKKAQQDPALRTQAETMKGYAQDIDALLRQIQKMQIQYAKIFNDRSVVFDTLDVYSDLVDEEIRYFREMRFSKTHPAFYEPEFLTFFDSASWERLKASIRQVFDYPFEDWQAAALYLGEFLIVHILITWVLAKVRKPDEDKRVFVRPLALAFVITLLIFKALTTGMTLLGEFAFWVCLLASVQWQLATLVRKDVDRRSLRSLIFVYGFLQIVNVIAIPLILYRLLIIAMALLLSAHAWHEVRQTTHKARQTRRNLMKALLALCFGTIVSEILGYHLLSVLLFQGTLQSVFAVFVAWQLRYMFVKILLSLFTVFEERDVAFFKNFKILLIKKLRFLSDVLGLMFLFGLFLSIWGIYPDVWAGVQGFCSWGMTFQKYRVTLGSLLQASFVLYLTHLACNLITNYLDTVLFPRRGIPVGSGKAINTLIKYFAWVVGVFFAVSALGFSLQQFAIIASALSVGIGFGLQNIVNNFVSGLILLFERPIKVGDMVELQNDSGLVEKVGLRSTIIRTASKTQLIIPNSDLITQRVTNMTLSDRDFRVRVAVNVAYGTDPELVKAILLNVAHTTPEVLSNPEPLALLTKIGDGLLTFDLFVWINDVAKRLDVMNQLHFRIDAEFRKNQIKLPTTGVEVKLKLDNHTK